MASRSYKLYLAPVSKPSQAVAWFLKVHNVPHVELVPLNLLRSDHMTAAYTEKNVYQTVPMLEFENGTRITESQAIMLYFARLHNIAGVIPADPLGEAQAVSAMLHHESLCRRGAILGRKILNKARNPKLTWDQVRESIESDREELQWVLETVNHVLGKSAYIAGEAWTIPDYVVAGELFQWQTIPDELLPESIRVSKYPNVGRYLSLAAQHPGFDEFTRPYSYLVKLIDAAAAAANAAS